MRALALWGCVCYTLFAMGNALTPAAACRLPEIYLETAARGADRIKPLVRMKSPTLERACTAVGMPADMAELCSGLLASVIDDLQAVGSMSRKDFKRTRRMQRILESAEEPARSALRLAIAASPLNGRAAVAHWDAICDSIELGKFAWLLGVDTDTARAYGRRRRRDEE